MRLLGLLFACLPLSATVVTFDTSVLLTQAYADQLGDWLGEGDLQLTRIYFGDPLDVTAFHAAADGQGRTFTVIEALTCSIGDRCIFTNAIIGGYNPQSWSSNDGSHLTPSDADRTAFIFNLSESRIARQILGNSNSNAGQFQTFNHFAYGPTFGGNDLGAGQGISLGFNYSYGPGYLSGTSIAGGNSTSNEQYNSWFTVGRVEVFTIADVAVPEPGTGLMAAGALAGVLLLRRLATRA